MAPDGASEAEVFRRTAGRRDHLVTLEGGDFLRPSGAREIAQSVHSRDLEAPQPVPYSSATRAETAGDVLERSTLCGKEDHPCAPVLSDLAALPPKYLLKALALCP